MALATLDGFIPTSVHPISSRFGYSLEPLVLGERQVRFLKASGCNVAINYSIRSLGHVCSCLKALGLTRTYRAGWALLGSPR